MTEKPACKLGRNDEIPYIELAEYLCRQNDVTAINEIVDGFKGEVEMSTLSKLPNVGKVLEKNLMEVGISTPDELRSIGAKEAFIRIRTIDSGACLHMLYGLQGAVEGIKDTALSDDTKADLRLFFKSL